MIVIKPDHARRIEIEGVANPVRRPVDIDQAKTGFASLRTLRIYRFDTDTMLEGHAEEDEVFIVVLSGTIELTMTEESGATSGPGTLEGPGTQEAVAAYLPPRASYLLKSKTEADVAYARATPAAAPSPKVFKPDPSSPAAGVTVLLEETSYATRLRVKLVQFEATGNDRHWACSEGWETFVHIRTQSTEKAAATCGSTALESWDTVAFTPNEHLSLQIHRGTSVLLLVVSALEEIPLHRTVPLQSCL